MLFVEVASLLPPPLFIFCNSRLPFMFYSSIYSSVGNSMCFFIQSAHLYVLVADFLMQIHEAGWVFQPQWTTVECSRVIWQSEAEWTERSILLSLFIQSLYKYGIYASWFSNSFVARQLCVWGLIRHRSDMACRLRLTILSSQLILVSG